MKLFFACLFTVLLIIVARTDVVRAESNSIELTKDAYRALYWPKKGTESPDAYRLLYYPKSKEYPKALKLLKI